ncbi:hypothetical protein SDC9_136901 [bioreactor metagenome]|uniref:Uncharacterized protein n=1 Tax=bioreactor metagenome TaxID=1076179 RepID=A0A645DKF4_9ZZZZ
MAVEGQVALALQVLHPGNKAILIVNRHKGDMFILLIGDPLFIRAAQSDMMKGMNAPVPLCLPDISFRLHAGDDQETRLGRVVHKIVAVMVGQRDKIIALLGKGPQQLRRFPAPVGPGGVAVQRPAQQGKIRAKSSLTVYHTLSILLIFIFARPGGRKSLPVP